MDAPRPPRRSTRASGPRSAAVAVVGRSWRSGRTVALAWGAVFGTVVASSALGYRSAYPSAADRAALARSLGGNVGLRAMFGAPRQLDGIAGFTAWRSLTLLGVLGAVWSLLATTRLLRGEEEGGRWELLVATGTDARRATVATCTGMAASIAEIWVVATAGGLAAGQVAGFGLPAAMFFALALVAPAAVAVGVGALCSQLATSRRRAATLGAATLGAAFVLRMLADSVASLRWMRWTTPFGWVELLHPLTGSSPAPLLLLGALTATMLGAGAVLAGRRDLGRGVLGEGAVRAERLGGLDRAIGLSARLALGSAVAWTIGAGLGAFALGLVARSAGDAAARSPVMQDAVARMGGSGDGARAYLGIAFMTIDALIALQAAGAVAAIHDEETSGRLDGLLVRHVARTRWLGGRIAIALVACTTTAGVCGLAAWCGGALTGADVPARALVAAGLNAVPAAAVVLGAGVATHGLLPRAAPVLGHLLIAWSFVVEMIGAVLNVDRRVLDTSLFHHLAPSPAAAPRLGTSAVLLGLAVLGWVIGVVAFARRDL